MPFMFQFLYIFMENGTDVTVTTGMYFYPDFVWFNVNNHKVYITQVYTI